MGWFAGENAVKDGCTLNILGWTWRRIVCFEFSAASPCRFIIYYYISYTSIFFDFCMHLCLFYYVWLLFGEIWVSTIMHTVMSCSLASVSWRCRRKSESLGHHQIPMSGCIWTSYESYIMNTYDSDTNSDYILRSEKNPGVKLSRTSRLYQSSTSMKSKTFGWGWGHSSIPVFSSTGCHWTYWTTTKAKDWKKAMNALSLSLYIYI